MINSRFLYLVKGFHIILRTAEAYDRWGTSYGWIALGTIPIIIMIYMYIPERRVKS